MSTTITVIADLAAEISERTDTTEIYKKKLTDMESSSSCTVEVSELGLGDGYRKLTISPSRETVSYRNEDGTVGYRTLTHVLNGKTMSFGLCCSPKGSLELFRFISSGGIDCEHLAKLKASKHVCDPMYALLSEDGLYVVYNVPSAAALASTVSQRVPQMGEDGASASGYPGIACFNLKTGEQSKLLPPFDSMPLYSCGLYFNTASSEPSLCIANIYNHKENSAGKPSLRKLFADIVDGDGGTLRSVKMPVGVSSISFVEKTEISQSPLDGDPENGIVKVILTSSNEDGEFLFSMKGKNESSGDTRE